MPVKPLRILILGGTGFIGPHQVEYALARGHTVTLFNRGQTNPGIFPKVEKLIGDRNQPNGYDALKGRTWDVVIDNPTQTPRWVREAGAVLKGHTSRYMFVSTLSAFRNRTAIGITEDGPLSDPAPADAVPVGAAFQSAFPGAPTSTYGSLKVRCENDARDIYGDDTIIVRPGLIVGPGDATDRFSYWPIRVEQGGEMLAPGTPDDPVAYVDERDLTEFMIRLAENNARGTFNVVGPAFGMHMGELLYGLKAVTTSDTRFTWVDADFLLARKLRPYADIPVWMPPRGATAGWARMDCSKAIAAGLTFRTLADTARATLDFFHAQPKERQDVLRAGLTPEQERDTLTAWHAAQGAH